MRGRSGWDGMPAAENYKSASFQEDKALCRRASGVLQETEGTHSLLEGRSWGQGEIAETSCLERSLGSIKSWDLDFSTTVQI